MVDFFFTLKFIVCLEAVVFFFFLLPNKHHSFIKRKIVKTKSIKISLALAYTNGLGSK